jgi:uncharacterized membrane protein YcaP (DUF421 family)
MHTSLVHFGLLDKTLRTIAVYLALLVLIHLAGKRELAQLTSFDLVVLLLLSNVVQNAVIGNDNSLLGGLFGAALIIAGNYVLVRFAFFHPRFGRALQGRSTTLVEAGRLDRDALRRELISPPQLSAALRREGIDGLDEVEQVVLEPEGALTPTKKPQPTIGDVLERLDRIEQKLAD